MRMNWCTWSVLLFVSVYMVAGCNKGNPSGKPSDKPLRVHVGGTMRPVMETLAAEHTKKTGQKVEINSAGSGELLAYIEGRQEGDLYVCHDPFLDEVMAKGFGIDGWTIAELTPVIVVQKGNPKNIRGVKDLTRKDVSLILTDYEKSTLGRILSTIFKKAGIDFDELNKSKKIETHRSGGFAANSVKMGKFDASMVWLAVASRRMDGLDVVRIDKNLPTPWVDVVTSATNKVYRLMPVRVTVATLTCSDQKAQARAFAEYIVSPEAGKILQEHGFTLAPERIRKEYVGGKKVPK